MSDTANGATMMPDELRDAIDEYCARDPADIFREALEHTIEERNTLIDMYNALKAENERLRQENQSIGMAAYELGRASLADENAKLRELCEYLWGFAKTCGADHPLLRELGVEVVDR